MRPVPTWKSTEAAPTPIKEGAISEPSAFKPWHEEQPFRNNCLPSSICAERAAGVGCAVFSADAESALNVVPVATNAKSRRTGEAKRALRKREIIFSCSLLNQIDS
jgi:hypothetical protein